MWEGVNNIRGLGIFGSEAFDGDLFCFDDCHLCFHYIIFGCCCICQVVKCIYKLILCEVFCTDVAFTPSWEFVAHIICCTSQWLVNSWIHYDLFGPSAVFIRESFPDFIGLVEETCGNGMFGACVNHCLRGKGYACIGNKRLAVFLFFM